MTKPAPRRVPSDDCTIIVDGVTYHPHEGEWVELRFGLKIGQLETYEGLSRLNNDLIVLADEPDGYPRQLQRVRELAKAIVPFLCERIVRWSWTDDDGAPHPQPKDDPTVFERLDFRELQYLMLLIRDGTPEEEKNASSASQTTSTASAQAETLQPAGT